MKAYIPLLLLMTACQTSTHQQHSSPDLSSLTEQEIIKAETDMSNMAQSDGFNKALLAFAGDSLFKPEEGNLPIIGKADLAKYWEGNDGSKEISWIPTKTEASMSGDLGYTVGDWKMVTRDTTFHGNYFTVWKKQIDGSWKWVVDGGNNTPQPK